MRVSTCVAGVLVAAAPASGGVLIGVSSGHALYEVDTQTGATTRIGTVSSNVHIPAGLAYDRVSDTVYLSSSSGIDNSLYTLDVATGVATLVGRFGPNQFTMHGLEFDDSTGTLYGGSTFGDLCRIDPITGAATPLGPFGGPGFLQLGYDPSSDTLYGDFGGILHIVNRQNGVRTPIGPLAGPPWLSAIAYNRDDGLMYALSNIADELYTMNLATGAVSRVGSTGPGENLLGLVYIPAPGTLVVVGVGVATARSGRRRR